MRSDTDKIPKMPQHRWLMAQRLAICTFLLISLSLVKTHSGGYDLYLQWYGPGLAALGLYYFLSIFYYYFPGHGRAAVFCQVSQIGADLALALCLSVITGGGESPFSFLFIIAIINSSFLGGIRSALVVATFSSLLWGGLLSLQDTGRLALWLPALDLNPEAAGGITGKLGVRMVRILINTGACYLVAFLSGYLAGQLFLSRRALVMSQAHLGRLADLNESIIQSIDSGLVTMDQSGLVLSVNRAGLEILGQRLADMVGRPWQLFWPQLEHILPLAPWSRAPFYGSNGLRFEYWRNSDGRELTLELNVMALVDSEGEVWGRLFVLKDLSSLLRMEEEVQKAEHLAALGELASGLAHELRTPLASMTGAWHMLSEDNLAPEDRARLTAIIGREMKRLAKLTNDFLSFARPARANPKVFDLKALIVDQLRVFGHSLKPGIALRSRLEDTPPIFFDQDQLTQVIWNLLANALEAGDQMNDMEILVETALDPSWPEHVALRISDNGPGIPRSTISKLFEPFFTTKAAGNGLGLPTVNRILHEGNGHITVDSIHKGLTTFSVFLPKGGAKRQKAFELAG